MPTLHITDKKVLASRGLIYGGIALIAAGATVIISNQVTKTSTPKTLTDTRLYQEEQPTNRLVAVPQAGVTSLHCAGYRAYIKYGGISNDSVVNISPKRGFIANFNKAIHPANMTATSKRTGIYEKQVWLLHPFITGFQFSTDQDYHVAMEDNAGNKLVAELVGPECTPKQSRFYKQISTVRAQWFKMFGDSIKQTGLHKQVWLTAIGFWDFPHSSSEKDYNQLELHPLLSIKQG